jgi:hypothetical protein
MNNEQKTNDEGVLPKSINQSISTREAFMNILKDHKEKHSPS